MYNLACCSDKKSRDDINIYHTKKRKRKKDQQINAVRSGDTVIATSTVRNVGHSRRFCND